MTRHQYGISALASQASLRGETSGGFAKCRLFSQASTTTSTRPFQIELMRVLEPGSFWQENLIAVVIVLRVLAKMSL